MDLPLKFMTPRFKTYDRKTDLDDHIAHYRQAMLNTSLLRDIREAGLCNLFGNSLSGPTLEWYVNLHVSTINSFSQLTYSFIENLSCTRKLEKQSDDLYAIRQKNGDTLRVYIVRFNKEKITIEHCN